MIVSISIVAVILVLALASVIRTTETESTDNQDDFCQDCGTELGYDDGPKNGSLLPDGRTVCHACLLYQIQVKNNGSGRTNNFAATEHSARSNVCKQSVVASGSNRSLF
ncbi:hypothetical protein [Stieleria varia]|uniref:Uncharacterized protein n=1 Tax=Stieleria varia TaxID=2528005 RepID=A0A5C6B820_9BACT|nr:hypothetical protein [Stieleria varia]TWU08415.1 hypothetical protein Pla52n_09980 [Stieleria varia]